VFCHEGGSPIDPRHDYLAWKELLAALDARGLNLEPSFQAVMRASAM